MNEKWVMNENKDQNLYRSNDLFWSSMMDCDEKSSCLHCDATDNSLYRYGFNFYQKNNGIDVSCKRL